MLKVLVASNYSSKNSYVRTIINGLRDFCDITCKIDAFWNSGKMFDVVHIQWPEELFYWEKVDANDLNKLKARLNYWQENGAKIVVTRHNELPHRRHPIDSELYDVVYGGADGVIHLGQFSRETFNFKHEFNTIINHPSYPEDLILKSAVEARKYLGLPLDGFMFLSLGLLRNVEEEVFLIENFIQYRRSNQSSFLVVCNLKNPARSVSLRRNPFERIRLEVFFLVKKLLLRRLGVYVDKNLIESEKLSFYLNSTDVVVVPRLDSLNSGVIYLGFTYGKPVIGPNIGNMKEVLSINDNPIFSPGNSEDLINAFQNAYSIADKLGPLNKQYSDVYCNPEKIAKEHLKFYHELRAN